MLNRRIAQCSIANELVESIWHCIPWCWECTYTNYGPGTKRRVVA